MKIDQIYSSNDGKSILFSKHQIWDELSQTLSNSKIRFEKRESQNIKMEISRHLNRLGWADSVKIEPTNLTINFIKSRVGLCIQLGNVARTYADLLKMQILYDRKIIDVGVIAVPVRYVSKEMGSNLAQYERLEEEVKIFDKIIKAPLIIIGLST